MFRYVGVIFLVLGSFFVMTDLTSKFATNMRFGLGILFFFMGSILGIIATRGKNLEREAFAA